MKTHDMPFDRGLEIIVKGFADKRSLTVLYPFRRASRTVVSFHRFCASHLEIDAFLESEDPYFHTGDTVKSTMRKHGEWGLKRAIPLNVDDVIDRPEKYAVALGRKFGWTVENILERRPPRRTSGGKVGELVERLRGRGSSEVVVPTSGRSGIDASFIDRSGYLADLFLELKECAFRPLV